jgi:hypothetical protein
MVHKTVVLLIVVAVIGLVGLVAGASARSPQPVAYKHCSAYAEEHFHDRNVNTPGGVKCVGAGEYCSHASGYSAAYHRAGLYCDSESRLEYD